jgi:chorismate dehydratase
MYRLGVVSFLNARPLIAGLEVDERVELLFDVPAKLPERLADGSVDAALIPIVDVLASRGRYRVLSDACIGCDGETMTVRVFSQVPPDRVQRLWVDGDSHTSVALARVLWRELYNRELALQPLDGSSEDMARRQAVLLIGDKVVDPGRGSFAYEVDLGGAWRQHTGLPFVFAVWAYHAVTDEGEAQGSAGAAWQLRERQLAQLLSNARDRGVARAENIAVTQGPELDAQSIEGANLFGRLCARANIVAPDAEVLWPKGLLPQEAV